VKKLALACLLLVVLTASLVSGCCARQSVPRFERAACQFAVPTGQVVDCGYLTVLERHDIPGSQPIRLHVAIFRTQSENPAPDPVVYLEGGPGGSALEAAPYSFNQSLAPFLADRDVIIFDQRGVGYSEPALDCPEVVELAYETLDEDLSPEEALARSTDAICDCHDRLVSEGVNLRAYNSAESAADLNDLRVALGYEEWNLFGTSYGTRLALTAMRDYPEGIRSVILDSTYPPQVSLYEEMPANADRAFTVFFEGCAADPVCSEAYPDLETVFYQLVDRLNASPVTFQVRQHVTGETYDVLFDGDALFGFVFQSLYATEVIPVLPKIILDVNDGNHETLAVLLGSYLAQMEFVSVGMQYSVQCGEEVRFSAPGDFSAAAAAYPELQGFLESNPTLGESLFTICEMWGAEEADPIENELVSSDIPTLVLAGEYDPIAPPAWGELAAKTLDNSFYYEFPGVGHGASVSGEGCPLSVALAFLDDPTAEPDTSCLARMDGPSFLVSDLDDVTLVPFHSEDFHMSGVAPQGWIEKSLGEYARSPLGLVGVLQVRFLGMESEQLLELLMSQFGLDEVPQHTEVRETDELVWSLFKVESGGLVIDIAVAQEFFLTYLVVLQSLPGERDFYYSEVYLPAIDALTPDV